MTRPWPGNRSRPRFVVCAAVVLLVAPRVFRAPEVPAAREARRPHFVRRRASKPARALRSLRRPPHQWCLVAVNSPARPRRRPPAPRQIPPAPFTPVGPGCLVCPWAAARPRAVRTAWRCLWPHGCCGRRRARPPARLGVLTSFGAAPRSPPVPSGPSGALHTCGTWSLMCGLARRLVVRLRLSISNFACNSPTALSNPEIRSLELQRYLTLLKLHPIELHATFLRPGAATTHGHCSLALPLATGIASGSCGPGGPLS